MKNKILPPLFALLLSFSLLQAKKNESLLNNQNEQQIFINNRILAKVNGKPISTYDLMKKMDMSFYRHFPHYSTSIPARMEFYDMRWKNSLFEVIDKELILSDAKESKVEVSSGDIRQEIEESFGPNVIENLDKAGISYEEATKMMREEIIIRRLISGRVHSKALRNVTPNKIRAAYDIFIQDPSNERSTQWTYRILTIKEGTQKKTDENAQAAYHILLEGIAPDKVADELKKRKLLSKKGKVTLSNSVTQNEKEMSSDYRDIVLQLDVGMYSQPFSQKSRSSKSNVSRILFIEGKVLGGYPTYKEMEAKLKENLMDQEVEEETERYLVKLRKHYHIRQSDVESYLPSDYKPFSLRNSNADL